MALTKITGEGLGTLAGDTTTLTLEDTSSHSANTGPAISFKSKDSGETTREVAKIVGESHSGSNEGNLAFQTRNGGTLETKWKVFKNGNLLPSNSSYGIYLGTSSAADANLLDDYEEGTWTPTLNDYAGTPTFQDSFYVKIGNLAIVNTRVNLDGTSDTSAFQLLSLPFTCLNSTASVFGGFVTYTNSTFSSNIYPLVTSNNTRATLYQEGGTTVSYNNIGANKNVRVCLVYRTT